MTISNLKSRFLSAISLVLSASAALAQAAPAPLAYNGATLTQDFNSLSSTNPVPNTNTTLPPGFGFVEAGGDATYFAGSGGENQGNTYSFGAAGSSERALGTLQSGSVVPTIGVIIRNNSGAALTQFSVAYTGEQYRLGLARGAGVADRLDFQYSTSATTINAATGFIDVDALDFVSPVTTGTAGPVSASTPGIKATVTGVSIEPGALLVLRWNDFNVTSSDDGLAIDDFSFSSSGGTGPTVTPTPPPPSTTALVSEFRTSGPGGSADEFIELFNASNAPLDVSGWSIGAGNVAVSVPTGTPALPVKGHFLLTGSAYSLGNTGGAGRASGDVSYGGDIADGAEITLRNAAGEAIDIVSGLGLPTPATGSQWSFARRLDSGAAQDSNVDSDDFNLLEVNSTSAGPPNTLGVSQGVLRLGAPGPENRLSPLNRGLGFGYVNPNQGPNVGDNGVRTGSGNSGSLSLRRTLFNTTGQTITRLRIRLAAITAGTPTGPNAANIADVRLMDGPAAFRVNGVDVTPLVVETVPNQSASSGGALNSTLSVALPAGGIAPGGSVSVEILLRVVKAGTFRTYYHFESLSETDTSTSDRPDDDNLLLGNPSQAQVLNAQGTNKENLLHEHTAWSLAYQQSMGGPRWVSWHLDQKDIGSSGRSSGFYTDTDLPGDCQINDNDYSGSGYTRGHQCPSGDRTASDALNREAFLMSNMLPQTASLNNGAWNDLENYCRAQLGGGANEIYIMSGGVGSNGRIAGGKVNAPASCWKVAVILPKGTNDITRITANTRVIAVLMPNAASVPGTYTNYLTTVDNIESLTGLDLLSNLADSVENALEAR